MTTVRAGAATDPGRVRSNNEDTSLMADDLFVVADGMGGHRAGEVASNVAVAALRAHFTDKTLDGLVEAANRANEQVFQQSTDDPELRGMGTTLVAVAIVSAGDAATDEDAETKPEDAAPSDELAWVNVGDSRLYLLRDGELSQLSEDHSLVEEMVRDGQLSPDEAATHPRRHIVTRALGIDPYVRVDASTVVPFTGDRYLLCSDGLYEEIDDSKVASTLRRLADPTEAARELVRLAVEAGGRDNVTVIVVDVVDDDDRARNASAAVAADPDLAGFTAAVPAAPPAADTAAKPRRAVKEAKPPKPPKAKRRRRRFTWRVVLFALAVIAVLGAAVGAVGFYARHTYFVGIDSSQVTIYRGRPGGFLWFEPTLEQRTDIAQAEVPAARLPEITDGKVEGSLGAALAYVRNLHQQIDEAGTTTTTVSTTTSTGIVRPGPSSTPTST